MLRNVWRVGRPAAAAVVSLLLLGFLALGAGPVPPLGSALDTGAGVWNAAADGVLPHSETIPLTGLGGQAEVAFDADGVPTVHAATDADLFRAQGYVQAVFRIQQLDLERRMAVGRLAELVGPSAVSSDTFELQSGLLRTAQAEWAATPQGSPAAQALTAFSQGVNDRLAELRRSKQWPSAFVLAGVYPSDWTPVDSLAIQELLTQNMDYTTAPLDYAILDKSLGAAATSAWFPVTAADQQHPYDSGPYRDLGIAPLSASANADAAVPAGAGSAQGGVPARATAATAARSATGATSASTAVAATAAVGDGTAGSAIAAADILQTVRKLPATEVHAFPDSNAWAADGPAVAGGGALLAGDPHLQLTLPSYWYEMALSSPATDVTGASLVGLPGILIGRNASISWSLTDTQNQSTVFYSEQTSPAHPGQYYWRGAWRAMQQLKYTIPVHGGAAVPLTVDLTVHGPVITQAGQTTSVDWMGNVPSPDMSVILTIDKATDFQQFRGALADWHAPTLNFVYADGSGNIGVVAAGYFPLTAAADPWLPLPGTGADDIVGTIPFAAAPQSYDPPGHVLATANQRPVAADYPYYVGTTMDAFDNGYRADEIYQYLDSHTAMTSADFSDLQDNVTDHLAALIVPKLTAALRGDALDQLQRQALDQLSGWDDSMTASSAGATLWWTFWNDYLSGVFQPWWNSAKVPVAQDSAGLTVSSSLPALDEDLEAWTLGDPGNPAFTPPGTVPGTARGSATTAMRTAFTKAVSQLSAQLGGNPVDWTWGRIHTRQIPSLTGAPALGYGPAPAGGDPWTVNAADGGLNSSFGPSWRMIVDWTAPGSATAQAIYPGGQSENPASPWYQNLVRDWWDGTLLPLRMPSDQPRSIAVWTLRPGG